MLTMTCLLYVVLLNWVEWEPYVEGSIIELYLCVGSLIFILNLQIQMPTYFISLSKSLRFTVFASSNIILELFSMPLKNLPIFLMFQNC